MLSRRRQAAEFNDASKPTTGINASRDKDGKTWLHMSVSEGDKPTVTLLFRRFANPNSFDNAGQTPLYDAIKRRDIEMIDLLLDKGAAFDVVDDAGRTPMMWAIEQGCDIAFLKQMQDLGFNLRTTNEKGRTLLHTAAEQNRPDIIAYLFGAGFDLNAVDDKGETALHVAVVCKSHSVMQALMVSGASAVVRTNMIRTPLHIAVDLADEAACDILLRDPAVCATVNEFKSYVGGMTPLMVAAENNRIAIAKKLLAVGADPNQLNSDTRHSLSIAVTRGYVELVNVLISAGADVLNAPRHPSNNATMVHEIQRGEGYGAILQSLLEAGADINAFETVKYTALHKACFSSYLKEERRVLLEAGADPNILDNYGRSALNILMENLYSSDDVESVTLLLKKGAKPSMGADTDQYLAPLHRAVGNGLSQITKALIAYGADVNECDKSVLARTPFLHATQNGNLEVMNYLLEKGADPLAVDKMGQNALFMAANQYSKEVIELLLTFPELLRDINLQDKQGKTPLHEACYNGRVNVVNTLLKKGADISIADSDGQTPLHRSVAVYNDSVLIAINEAMDGKVDWDVRTAREGFTPLHIAAQNGYRRDVIDRLLTLGADITALDNSGMTPMHYMAGHGDSSTIDIALRHMKDAGVTIEDLRDKNKRTVLHAAAASRYPSFSVIDALLQGGANVHSTTVDGDTALHLAASEGNHGLVDHLITKGADMERRNLKGQTVMDVAVALNRTDVVSALKTASDQQKARAAGKPGAPKP